MTTNTTNIWEKIRQKKPDIIDPNFGAIEQVKEFKEKKKSKKEHRATNSSRKSNKSSMLKKGPILDPSKTDDSDLTPSLGLSNSIGSNIEGTNIDPSKSEGTNIVDNKNKASRDNTAHNKCSTTNISANDSISTNTSSPLVFNYELLAVAIDNYNTSEDDISRFAATRNIMTGVLMFIDVGIKQIISNYESTSLELESITASNDLPNTLNRSKQLISNIIIIKKIISKLKTLSRHTSKIKRPSLIISILEDLSFLVLPSMPSDSEVIKQTMQLINTSCTDMEKRVSINNVRSNIVSLTDKINNLTTIPLDVIKIGHISDMEKKVMIYERKDLLEEKVGHKRSYDLLVSKTGSAKLGIIGIANVDFQRQAKISKNQFIEFKEDFYDKHDFIHRINIGDYDLSYYVIPMY